MKPALRLRPLPSVSEGALLPAAHSQFEITSWHYAIKGTIAVVGSNAAALKWLCGTPQRRNFPETVADCVSVFEAVHIAGGATRMVQTIHPSVTSQVWGVLFSLSAADSEGDSLGVSRPNDFRVRSVCVAGHKYLWGVILLNPHGHRIKEKSSVPPHSGKDRQEVVW